jgi:hypothetical protein
MNKSKLTYIFARTRGNYLEKIGVLSALIADIRGIFQTDCIVMSLTARPRLWSDGFVIAFMTAEYPASIAEALGDGLEGMSCWTIYQGITSFLEYPRETPMKEAAWALRDKPLSFFFLLAKANEFAFKSHTDSMAKSMKSSMSYPVFTFNDGIVLAVSTSEPPKVTVHRCYRSLQLFSHWIFCDSEGDCFRDDGKKDCWMEANLFVDLDESDPD